MQQIDTTLLHIISHHIQISNVRFLHRFLSHSIKIFCSVVNLNLFVYPRPRKNNLTITDNHANNLDSVFMTSLFEYWIELFFVIFSETFVDALYYRDVTSTFILNLWCNNATWMHIKYSFCNTPPYRLSKHHHYADSTDLFIYHKSIIIVHTFKCLFFKKEFHLWL